MSVGYVCSRASWKGVEISPRVSRIRFAIRLCTSEGAEDEDDEVGAEEEDPEDRTGVARAGRRRAWTPREPYSVGRRRTCAPVATGAERCDGADAGTGDAVGGAR